MSRVWLQRERYRWYGVRLSVEKERYNMRLVFGCSKGTKIVCFHDCETERLKQEQDRFRIWVETNCK